jgi:hypothetical protein
MRNSASDYTAPDYRKERAAVVRLKRLGMNLGLGWPAYQPTTFRQRLFLPTKLSQAWAHTTRQQRPFTTRTQSLLAAPACLPARCARLAEVLRRGLLAAVRGPSGLPASRPPPVFAAYAGPLQLPAFVAAADASGLGYYSPTPLVAALYPPLGNSLSFCTKHLAEADFKRYGVF